MRRVFRTFGLGLLIGVIGSLIYTLPGGMAWEENTGLGTLFKLRGQRPAPNDVVIVAVDDNTVRQLGLDRERPDLPRSTYARLIDRLAAAGTVVIVFDIFFKKARDPDQDEQLAAAIRRAGNVLLFGYLEQETVPTGNAGTPLPTNGGIQIERLRPPLDILADPAAGVAPFVLPKIPVRINRFWTFHGANELPALPSAALKLYAGDSIPDLTRLLATLESDHNHLVVGKRSDALTTSAGASSIHALLRNNPHLDRELLKALASDGETIPQPESRRRLNALLTMYITSDYPYLNFYGPPRSITTIPLPDIIAGDPDALATVDGKAVFVGYAGRYQPKQQDGFYTVFSQPSGLDLSGVEIGATAFANLLNTETLAPLEPGRLIAVISLYGILIVLIFRLLPAYLNIGTGLLAATLYFLLVYRLFADANIWLPWTVPLFVQTPLALFAALVWNYREARHSRRRLREVFGYYLPGNVIDQLAHDRNEALAQGEPAFGVCLATDAEQYTSLAETMDAAALRSFMNRYYELLFAPVRARGGMISDVIGDAMLAIWSAPRADASLRKKACEAALEITQQLRRPDQTVKLPTRIGLHAGQIVLSHIGAIDHYEYRAVGDIVNTASRIEGLNKQLNTSILASQETVDGLDGLVTRELGPFQLKGKQQLVMMHEVMCTAEAVTADVTRLKAAFADALAACQQQSWQAAIEKFQTILETYPDDGPSRYYLARCRDRRNSD